MKINHTAQCTKCIYIIRHNVQKYRLTLMSIISKITSVKTNIYQIYEKFTIWNFLKLEISLGYVKQLLYTSERYFPFWKIIPIVPHPACCGFQPKSKLFNVQVMQKRNKSNFVLQKKRKRIWGKPPLHFLKCIYICVCTYIRTCRLTGITTM